jgi:BNR repeat-like domain
MLFWVVLFALHLGPVTPSVPNRQPQLAAAKGLVAMTFASGESIWLAKSTDEGRSWGAPAKVADLPKLLAGRHRGPRVVITQNALLVSAVPTGSDLFCWRSTDGGHTWSKPAVVNDAPTSAREGLHAMAADGEGHVAAAWLDDRVAGGKRLWGAFSDDGGATWSKNVLLYESSSGTICQCCHPSLIALGHGEFAVMWRNVVDGSRDFYVLRLRAGKPQGAAVKQGQGTWKLDACPMDGGGMALDHGEIVTAWRREHNVFLARPGRPEVDLGPGQDIALAEGRKGPVAIWVSGKSIRLLEPGAAAAQTISESGAFPSILTLPGGALLASWEEDGAIATRRVE